jgi:nucleotide-binding universal stress UspA family protein
LAYDGSPKANEALSIAAYLADKWPISLVVVTVMDNGHIPPNTLSQAQGYLESLGVQATYMEASGSVPEAILKTAEEHTCDLIIMGGYGHGPVLEVVLGSAVDQVLRASQQPTLICR